MIRFSDFTIAESKGSFSATKQLMEEDGAYKWMLETNATVTTDVISCNYVIHLWDDGNIYIMNTDHPAMVELPDDDIRELHQWSIDNGWSIPIVHDRLVDDQRQFEFWLRSYRAGLVQCNVLKKYDENEMERLVSMLSKEDQDA